MTNEAAFSLGALAGVALVVLVGALAEWWVRAEVGP